MSIITRSLVVLTLVLAACGAPADSRDGGEPTTQPPPATTTSLPTVTTEAPPPLITPREGDELAPTTMVSCPNGPSFPLAALKTIVPLAERPDLAAAIAPFLADEEGQFWPQDGWQVLHATDTEAVMVNAGADEEQLWFMSASYDGTEWKWSGASAGGPCPIVTQIPEGLNQVDWRLDPDAPAPAPEDTTIAVLITERECVSGQEIGDRLVGPEVILGPDTVRIAFAAVPPTGDAFNCQGNPETPFTIDLGEPLSDRTVEQGLNTGLDLADFLG